MMNRKRRRTFDAVAATLMIVSAAIAGAFLWGAVVLVALLLGGCTTTKYVPVETVRTEYQDKVKEVHTTDSVVDTRFVYVKGDTVVDWRDRVKWRDRFIHDSVFIETHDTVPQPYPVEREFTRWERTKIDYGGVAIWILVLGVCIAVIWLTKKRR